MGNTDSERITVRCRCGAKLKLPAAAAGRKARCPKCEKVFTVPDLPAAPKNVEPAAVPAHEPADGLSAFEELAEQEHTATAQSPPDLGRMHVRCPECGTAIPGNAALCVQCGYNVETGKQTKGASVGAAKASAAARRVARGAGGFVLGCVLSAVGALIGAAIWAGVALATEYEIGWIAWGLGVLAGGGMVLGYREKNQRAGVVAAGIAVLGIAAARIMIVVFFVSSELGEFVETREFKEMVLAVHLVQPEAWERNLPPWADEPLWELCEQKQAEKLRPLGGLEFAQAWESFQDWSSDAKWEDADFVRLFLIHHLACQGLPDDMDGEPPIDLAEWEERSRTAAAEVDAMTPAARVVRAKELKVEFEVPLDADEIEAWMKDFFEETARQNAQEDIPWTELFVGDPIDIIFILLALVTAFKLASGTSDE